MGFVCREGKGGETWTLTAREPGTLDSDGNVQEQDSYWVVVGVQWVPGHYEQMHASRVGIAQTPPIGIQVQ